MLLVGAHDAFASAHYVAIYSIIAVHGLDGHWKRSWVAKNGVFWLQDLLPQAIPEARVYSYGYDSRTRGSSFPLTLDITEGGKELVAELALERELTKVCRCRVQQSLCRLSVVSKGS